MTHAGVAGALAVRDAERHDAEAVAAIYNHHVLNTIVTFEEVAIASDELWGRIEELCGQGMPWLVAERGGVVVGYAYGGKWHRRAAYRYSSEVTVYVAVEHVRTGVGVALYSELLPRLKSLGMRTALGGIALPNEGSVALHERFGFAKAAHYSQVGFKLGRWIDVGYWQLML